MTKDITVEQVDREAAAAQWNRQNQPLVAERCALGRADNSILAQAFARHRHTSTLQAQEQIKVLREALERIADGDYPMPHHDIYRSDSVHSKHDRCPHGRWMYEGCDECCADYARQALEATNG